MMSSCLFNALVMLLFVLWCRLDQAYHYMKSHVTSLWLQRLQTNFDGYIQMV